MECRPPSPSPSPVQEAAPHPTTTPTTPLLVTSEGHLVFPLPLLQGLDAPTLTPIMPTPSTGAEDTPAPTPAPASHSSPTPTSAFTPVTSMTPTPTLTPITNITPTPRPTTPRPTTPRRPTPRRPAPQPPTRPAPPTTPVPQLPAPTPTPEHTGAARPTSPASTRSASPMWERSLSTTPVPELVTPTPPGSSVGVGGLSLRLIDDETDTDDDGRCDSFEERLVFPPRPAPPPLAPLAPARLTLTRPPPLTLPTAQPPAQAAPRPAIQAAQHTPGPPRPPPPPAEAQWWDGGRRAHRGLAHSSSDPGLRRPPMWSPAAPLQQVPEERDGGVVAPHLARSDSVVTVPQDLLAPRPSLAGAAAAALVAAALMPGTAMLLHAAFRVVFGTLFPAYYSYKAVKTKNVKEYVKWMMYWIVFAFFTCLETLTDIFLSFWFPFYYELKILVVLWLLSPATRGSSFLYRKFVHPWLTQREEDIDNCIAQAKEQGYSAVLTLGSKGINYATSVIMQTAIKGGGGLMSQLKRSYSSGELISDGGDLNRNIKPMPLHLQDPGYDPHHQAPGPYDHEPRVRAESDAAYKPRGSSASRVVRSTKTRSADVTDYYQDAADEGSVQRRRSPRNQDSASRVLSADDLTSGYSSSGDLDPPYPDLAHPDPPAWDEDDLPDLPDPHDPPGPPPAMPCTRKRSQAVRRTQSLSASSLALHRAGGGRRGGEGRAGHGAGRGGAGAGGQVSDVGPPAYFSSSGHPPSGAPPPQHGPTFRRSRPGEVSAYATLPRTTTKRTAAKKRQV